MAADRVRVRVPATSANLGPGFDALGLALALHDELDVRLSTRRGDPSGLVIEPYGDVPTDETNLVARGLRAAFAATGEQPDGLVVRYLARIPHARGLGSSAAAICAGVVAGLALRGMRGLEAAQLALHLADGLEGHPDNVAACLAGGATIAWYDEDEAAVPEHPRFPEHPRVPEHLRAAQVARLDPHGALAPVVFVPPVRTSTEASRGTLPATVAHRDAAFSAGRSALLVTGLTARPDLLLAATADRLHQPYRLPDLPESQALVRGLRAEGVPAVLSGSGPTVLALCREPAEVEVALRLAERTVPDRFAARRVPVDRQGCVVLP